MHAARPAAIDVIVAVDLHTVGRALAGASNRGKDSVVVDTPVAAHLEQPDVAALGVVDVEPALVAREAEPIRLGKIVDEQREPGAVLREPVDAAEFELGLAR